MIKATVTLKGLDRTIRNLTKTDMGEIAVKVIELQNNQIMAKKDAKGRRFVPYSLSYAKRKGVSSGQVTLVSNSKVRQRGAQNRSGHMLKEFGIIRIGKNYVTVGWTSPANKAKAKGNYNTRKFVGLSPDSRKRLYKYISNMMGFQN